MEQVTDNVCNQHYEKYCIRRRFAGLDNASKIRPREYQEQNHGVHSPHEVSPVTSDYRSLTLEFIATFQEAELAENSRTKRPRTGQYQELLVSQGCERQSNRYRGEHQHIDRT